MATLYGRWYKLQSGSIGDMKNKKRWYEKVKAKMAELGISYSDLAARLSENGIETAKSTVGAWMVGRNEPSLAVIKEIGGILGMSVSEIISEEKFFIRDPVLRQIVERLESMSEDERKAVLKFLSSPAPIPQD